MKNYPVLIVDDDKRVCEDLNAIIDMTTSYHSDIALTHNDAIEMLRKNSYTLVISDLMLTSGDDFDDPQGLRLIEWISKNHLNSKIILYSAYLTPETSIKLSRINPLADAIGKEERIETLVKFIKDALHDYKED